MATPTNAHPAASAAHPPDAGHHPVLPHWLTHLGGLGLFFVAILDSSPIPLPLPGSTDLLLLFLVAHRGNPFLLAASAFVGSSIGGYITWSAGKKGGEALIRRSVPERYRQAIEHWTNEHSLLSVMLPAILPPPIPLTPFLLAAGALGVSRRRFLVSYNVARLVRYSLVSWLGVVYGRQMVHWWTHTLAGWSAPIEWTIAALFIGGILYGVWKYRRMRQAERTEAPPEALPAS